jgi:hypothetical protein
MTSDFQHLWFFFCSIWQQKLLFLKTGHAEGVRKLICMAQLGRSPKECLKGKERKPTVRRYNISPSLRTRYGTLIWYSTELQSLMLRQWHLIMLSSCSLAWAILLALNVDFHFKLEWSSLIVWAVSKVFLF